MSFTQQLKHYVEKGFIPSRYAELIASFHFNYQKELKAHHLSTEMGNKIFCVFLDLVKQQILSPHQFQPYHPQIREPFDYYAFGLDFIRPLVDRKQSAAFGLEFAQEIDLHIQNGNNVILLANHQIEADPQAISLLLEDHYPHLAVEMIFVAGERVITDPLAVPFSLGRNLLCIYSKRYIDHPPELKLQKQLHNKRTMELMSELLCQGGKCIYVAPSGGRDRAAPDGTVEVAAFDAQSIEMFNLMAKKATRPTFFYSLALQTYNLLPPPQTVQIELGETRITNRGGIHLCFGPSIDMAHYPGSDHPDKHERRVLRAHYIWQQVQQDYRKLASFIGPLSNISSNLQNGES